MERVRLAIVSHEAALRARFRAYVEPSDWLELVAVTACGHEAITGVVPARPDIVLIDEDLPGLDGPTVAAILLRDVPGLRVVQLVPVADFDHLATCAGYGGATALSRDAGEAELFSCLRAVRAEAYQLHPWPVPQLGMEFADGHDPRQAGIAHTLTGMQAALLDCLLTGLNGGEIVRALGITNYGLRKETLALFRALGVEKKVGAITVALERRWTCLGRRAPTVTVTRPADFELTDPDWLLGRIDAASCAPFDQVPLTA